MGLANNNNQKSDCHYYYNDFEIFKPPPALLKNKETIRTILAHLFKICLFSSYRFFRGIPIFPIPACRN